MDHPEIIQRERLGVPDAPTEHKVCHHCDTFRGFERACGCVGCRKFADECFDKESSLRAAVAEAILKVGSK